MNNKSQVLDESYQPIPNLYASGNASGSMFAGREREKDTSEFLPFSKSGFTDDYRSAAKKTDCALVSLADMKLGDAELL